MPSASADAEKHTSLTEITSPILRSSALPADGVIILFVLFVEPGFKGREIIGDGASIHCFLAGQRFEGFWPRLALAHAKHPIEFFTHGFVSVERAAVKRAGVAGRFAKAAIELELQN